VSFYDDLQSIRLCIGSYEMTRLVWWQCE